MTSPDPFDRENLPKRETTSKLTESEAKATPSGCLRPCCNQSSHHGPKGGHMGRREQVEHTSSTSSSSNSKQTSNLGGNSNLLRSTTQKAVRAEKDRLKRLQAKQILFEKIFSDDNDLNTILDFDPESKKPLVRIHKAFADLLKPHQLEGVKFLFDSIIESVDRLKDDPTGSGCILAHLMGLGKTLQAIVLLHTLLTNKYTRKYIGQVLVVVPYNVIENWAQEFEKWIETVYEEAEVDWKVKVHEMRLASTPKDRIRMLKKWYKKGGILLVSNKLFSNTVSSLNKRKWSRREAKSIKKYLLNPGPDLVIIDEGHLLKNASSQLNQSLKKVFTGRRIVLTGTPLQNNLGEYFTMVDYVKPNLLGTRKEFQKRFQGPIKRGQNKDSKAKAVSTMKKRIHVLTKLLKGVIHRADYNVLVPYLQPKNEYVLFVSLTPKQIAMYTYYLDSFTEENKSFLRDKAMLALVWTHPILVHDYYLQSAGKTEDNWVKGLGPEWYKAFVNVETDYRPELSNKLTLLFELLEASEKVEDKVVVFSQSLLVLNLLEKLLQGLKSPEDDQENTKIWLKNSDYFRIDGGVDSSERSDLIKRFNDPTSKRARLILVSTRAGGIGVNLVGANRAVIFDASFNPANDLQAIFRIYRLGQKKPVFIYRLVAFGTMEEKIYRKQILKQSLSRRILDEQQVVRHYSKEEMAELYELSQNYQNVGAFPVPEKDQILKGLLSKFKGSAILSIHEHDSLLEHDPHEELSDEERSIAEEEEEEFEMAREREEKILEEEFKKAQEKEEEVADNLVVPELKQNLINFMKMVKSNSAESKILRIDSPPQVKKTDGKSKVIKTSSSSSIHSN